MTETVRALGFTEVTGLDWWDHAMVGPIRVTAVPAAHNVRENGYVVASNRVKVYVAGDTRWFDGLVDIAAAFPNVDVACLPIGGETAMGFSRTMRPGEAAKAAVLLKARRVIPIAYGAAGGYPFVWYIDEPVVRFRAAAETVGLHPDQVVVLEPGESWHYFR
jgi:L-ascorbate metabolism protein UlaG (beta-lactamase superfamily)